MTINFWELFNIFHIKILPNSNSIYKSTIAAYFLPIDRDQKGFPLVLCGLATGFPVPVDWSEVVLEMFEKSASETSNSGFFHCTGFLRANQWFARLVQIEFFTQVCHCSVNTELIDRSNDANKNFNCIMVTTEMFEIIFHLLYFSKFFSRKLIIMISATLSWLSAKFVSVCAVPCLFWSEPEEWPMSERESSCIVGHIDGINNTNLFVLQITPYDVILHRHEDDSSFVLFWCTLHFTHHSLDLGENLQRGESRDFFSLEFHWFSIDSIQFSVLVGTLEPHPLIFPIQHYIMGKGVPFQDTIQNLRIHRLLPSKIGFLRHSIKIVFPVEQFANKFVTLPRCLLLALESVCVTPRTISLQ